MLSNRESMIPTIDRFMYRIDQIMTMDLDGKELDYLKKKIKDYIKKVDDKKRAMRR